MAKRPISARPPVPETSEMSSVPSAVTRSPKYPAIGHPFLEGPNLRPSDSQGGKGPKIYTPTRSPEDWQEYLARKDKHWKPGYSAWALAHSWQGAAGFLAGCQRRIIGRNMDISLEMVYVSPPVYGRPAGRFNIFYKVGRLS